MDSIPGKIFIWNHFLEPRTLTLDFYDDPLLYGLPEDRKLEDRDGEPGQAPKPFDRKVRLLYLINNPHHHHNNNTNTYVVRMFSNIMSSIQEHQFTKKSKMILGQVQQRQKQEEEEQMESSVAQMSDKDPFNLSNDDYYMPKNINKYERATWIVLL